jgi:hypothetical protein
LTLTQEERDRDIRLAMVLLPLAGGAAKRTISGSPEDEDWKIDSSISGALI